MQRYKPRSIRHLERRGRKNVILSLIIIGFFCYVLIFWGLPNLIGGLSVFNKLKAQTPKTRVEDVSLAPPILNIPFEATSSSVIQIKGFATTGLRVEIYLDDELKDTVDTVEDGSFSTKPIDLAIGTNNIRGVTADSSGNKSLSSKLIRVIYDNEKPKLEVSEPEDNKQIKGGDRKIKVVGKTNPENSVTVNLTTVIINNEGNFSTEIALNEGDNSIVVTAINKVGNTTTIQRKVTFSP